MCIFRPTSVERRIFPRADEIWSHSDLFLVGTGFAVRILIWQCRAAPSFLVWMVYPDQFARGVRS